VARALAAANVPPELVAAWCACASSWFGPERRPLPHAPAKSELALVESPLGRLVAKRMRGRGLRGTLARLGLARGRAARAFRLAAELTARGLATPEALAVLPLGDAQVLLTRHVEGPHPWEFLAGGGDARTLAATLARELARLHAAGFRHRDLKASNLIVHGAQASPTIVWTDLDGLAPRASVGRRLRTRDLARLSMSFESGPARAVGVRADLWPALAHAYLAAAFAREPRASELEQLLVATRRWRERAIRRHLARGQAVR